MSSSPPDSFERVFHTRDLFRGRPLFALILCSLAGLVSCAALLVVFLLGDVLVHQGQLSAEADALLREHELRAADTDEIAGPHAQSNRGLWPTVARLLEFEAPGAHLLARLVQSVPWLESTDRVLLVLLLCGIALLVVRSLVLAVARGLSAHTAMHVALRLRRSLHRQALRLGPADLRDRAGQTVLELFTTEVERIREGVERWIYRWERHPVQLLLFALVALAIDPLLALQCAIPLALCWYFLQRQEARRLAAERLQRDRAQEELRRLSEGLQKTRLVRGFGMEAFEQEQFQTHLERYHGNLAALNRSNVRARLGTHLFVVVCLGLVLLLVSLKVGQPPGLSLAGAVTLLATLAWMVPSFNALRGLSEARRNVRAAAERVFRFLAEIPAVGQAVGARFLQPLSGELKFEDVSYAVGDRTLLKDFDLTIRAGEVVALVSLDPLEARTVAYMLPRFVEPQSGRILVDGEDIAWVTLESLRAETIFVGGDDPSFTGTVFENISCGSREYTLQDATEAAKLTHAHNFVIRLPQGYETVIGEHGERLDTGQGYRLGLARAVVRNPAVLILEEPHARLDEDTKSLLDDAYDRILTERTVVLLPSRLSTLRRASRIVVVHRGRVEAEGTYQEVVRRSPIYRHWEYVSFNEFRQPGEDGQGG